MHSPSDVWWNPKPSTADLSRLAANRSALIQGARAQRLAARAHHRPSRPRRAVARHLLALVRRIDPSLHVPSSLPSVHAG